MWIHLQQPLKDLESKSAAASGMDGSTVNRNPLIPSFTLLIITAGVNEGSNAEISLRQVHVVAAVNSVCLGAATTLTQTLGSQCSSLS